MSSLQALWSEGQLLAETLKVQVPMPMPTKVTVSVVDSVARVQPILSGAAAAVDVTITSLSAGVAEFDNALALIGALRSARELDARHRALAQQRTGMPVRMEGFVRGNEGLQLLRDDVRGGNAARPDHAARWLFESFRARPESSGGGWPGGGGGLIWPT